MTGEIIKAGVVIPAFNEEKTIGETLRALRDIPEIQDILVVDDGSWDKTAQTASEAGVQVLKLPRNYGKGYALLKGLEEQKQEVIMFLDADLGESARDAGRLLEPIRMGRADVVIARFPFTKGAGGVGMVKGISRFGVKILTGKSCTSILSGQRAFRRGVIKPEFLKYPRFGIEFGMTVDLLNQGIPICEVEVEMRHRVTGRDLKGFQHRARQFKDITQVILNKMLLDHRKHPQY